MLQPLRKDTTLQKNVVTLAENQVTFDEWMLNIYEGMHAFTQSPKQSSDTLMNSDQFTEYGHKLAEQCNRGQDCVIL